MGLFSNINSIIAENEAKSPAIKTASVKSEFEETNDYIAELQRKIDADKPRTAKQIQQDTAGGSVLYLKAIGEKLGITFSEEFIAECGKLELQPEEIVAIAGEFKAGGFSNTMSIKNILEKGKSTNVNSSLSSTTSVMRSIYAAVAAASESTHFLGNGFNNRCVDNSQFNCLERAVHKLYPSYSDEQVKEVFDEWRKKLD